MKDTEIKGTAMKLAFFRAVAIVIAILGGITLAFALTGDKSWDSISLGITLIAIGLSYEGLSTTVTSDFKLNVINEKIEFLDAKLEAIQALLAVEEKLNKMKANIDKIEVKREEGKLTSK